MREKLQRFMQGRSGYDALSRFLVWVSVALLLISMFTARALNGVLSNVLWGLAIAVIVWSYYRVFSKNIDRRRAENAKYYVLMARVKGFFGGLKQRWRDRKAYKYFRCPSCRALMRVPRHKGKVNIRCKTCGKQFMGKT